MCAPSPAAGRRNRSPSTRASFRRRRHGCRAARGPGRARGPNRPRRAAGWARPAARSFRSRACRPRRTACGSCPAFRSGPGGRPPGSSPRSPLGAGLEDPLGLTDRVVQGLARPDGQAARLLAVDVLAGLGRQDRRRRVPAVAGGDHHRVDVGAGPAARGSRGRGRNPCCRSARSTSFLPASRRLACTSQMATQRTSALGQHAAQIVGHAGADADHSQRDPLAGRHGAVAAQGAWRE